MLWLEVLIWFLISILTVAALVIVFGLIDSYRYTRREAKRWERESESERADTDEPVTGWRDGGVPFPGLVGQQWSTSTSYAPPRTFPGTEIDVYDVKIRMLEERVAELERELGELRRPAPAQKTGRPLDDLLSD